MVFVDALPGSPAVILDTFIFDAIISTHKR